jgi:hypothetical protein
MSVLSYDSQHPVYKAPIIAALLACSKKMDMKSLRYEPELFSSRWPVHIGDPHTLTFKFAQAYQAVFKRKFREVIDKNDARGVRGIDLRKFVTMGGAKDKSGVFAALNNARQVADASGLPYEVFLRFCFDFSIKRGCKMLPAANQLVPSKGSEFELPFYRELGRVIDDELPIHKAKYRAQYPQSISGGVPSCIGVIGARDSKSDICNACPNVDKCGKICEKLAAVIFKMETDMGKPVALADRQREQATARKAKQRAKEKAGKLNQGQWVMT